MLVSLKLAYPLSGSNCVLLIEYTQGNFEVRLGAKIASVISGHNVTYFDYEAMISPLFRLKSSQYHYIIFLFFYTKWFVGR